MVQAETSKRPTLWLVVYSLARGGAERVSVEMARAWVARGADVTLVTMVGSEHDFFEPPAEVRRLNLGATASQGSLIGRIRVSLFRVVKLRRLMKRERPDAVLGIMTTAGVLVGMSSIGLGLRTIGSERTFPPNFPLGAVAEWLRRIVYSWLTVVTAQTREGARWLERNTGARQISVIPNSVIWPLPNHAPSKPPPVTPGRRLLVTVGRLGPEKQTAGLIKTFAKLAERHRDWDLAVVGGGGLADELAGLVRRLGMEERIQLVGPVGNVADWYRASSAFALTSKFEGFPNALLEAMSHELPVVSFDCQTGPAEMIVDGENGLLVPADDFSALEASLDRVFADASLRARLGRSASLVRDQFSESAVMSLWARTFGPRFEALVADARSPQSQEKACR